MRFSLSSVPFMEHAFGVKSMNSLHVYAQLLSRILLFVTSWTAAHQAPLSMGFSRQKCWSGLPLPSPGYLPNPGIEPSSPDYRQTIYCLSHRGTQWIKFYLASIMSNQSSNTGVGCHFLLQCMRVKSESEVAQSCPTLSDPMDCSPPGSSVHGSCQARAQEWGASAFSEKKP